MTEIETKFDWKSHRDEESGYTFSATTDEHNVLRVFQYPTGFWGASVNGTDVHDDPEREGTGVFGDATGAIRFVEKHGDQIAAKQIENE